MVRVGVGRHGVRRTAEHWLLPDLWSMHLYTYHGDLMVDDQHVTISPGSVTVVPAGTPMRFRYAGPSTHLFAHLRLPPGRGGQRIAVRHELGADERGVRTLWEDAVAAFPLHTDRARADMWSVLWRLVDPAVHGRAEPRPRHHQVVSRAIGYLEMHLADVTTVPELARHVGVSHNHLTRLFRRDLDSTVVEYIRRRRIEHAEHLLRDSTLAITSIAAAVGIPDLQAFNKAVRRERGRSPTEIRRQGRPS